MQIRYVCSDEEHRTDAALVAAAERAAQAGIRVAGTLQPVDPALAAEKCHIVLALLPDMERRDISLDLGPGAMSCRLDGAALEQAAITVRERLHDARALVVNKFGKQEAVGKGLVAAIGDACDRGLPVLVGVSPAWRQAFLDFAGSEVMPLPADGDAIFEWLRDAVTVTAEA